MQQRQDGRIRSAVNPKQAIELLILRSMDESARLRLMTRHLLTATPQWVHNVVAEKPHSCSSLGAGRHTRQCCDNASHREIGLLGPLLVLHQCPVRCLRPQPCVFRILFAVHLQGQMRTCVTRCTADYRSRCRLYAAVDRKALASGLERDRAGVMR